MKSLQAVLMLIACFLPCVAQYHNQSGGNARIPELNPQAWREFTSAEGGFAVRMPSRPAEARRPLPPPNESITMHTFIASTAAEYGVTYADFPWPIEGTERVGPFFDGVVKMGVQAIGGKLLELREQDYRGHPGRIYRAEFSGGYHIRTLAFVVQNRLYMVTASTYGNKAPSPVVAQLYEDAAEAYLDSFRLTSGGGQATGVGDNGAERDAPKAAVVTPAEGDVDRLLKELRARNEVVIGTCDEGADCKPLPGGDGVNKPNKERVRSGGIVSQPQPAYPPIAKAARAQGVVTVQVVVDEEGKIIAAQAVSGHPLLQAAAVAAARQALFTPTLLDGKPVKISGVITYNFALR